MTIAGRVDLEHGWGGGTFTLGTEAWLKRLKLPNVRVNSGFAVTSWSAIQCPFNDQGRTESLEQSASKHLQWTQ